MLSCAGAQGVEGHMDMNAVVDNSGLMLLMVRLATMPNSGLDISVEMVSNEQGPLLGG